MTGLDIMDSNLRPLPKGGQNGSFQSFGDTASSVSSSKLCMTVLDSISEPVMHIFCFQPRNKQFFDCIA